MVFKHILVTFPPLFDLVPKPPTAHRRPESGAYATQPGVPFPASLGYEMYVISHPTAATKCSACLVAHKVKQVVTHPGTNCASHYFTSWKSQPLDQCQLSLWLQFAQYIIALVADYVGLPMTTCVCGYIHCALCQHSGDKMTTPWSILKGLLTCFRYWQVHKKKHDSIIPYGTDDTTKFYSKERI